MLGHRRLPGGCPDASRRPCLKLEGVARPASASTPCGSPSADTEGSSGRSRRRCRVAAERRGYRRPGGARQPGAGSSGMLGWPAGRFFEPAGVWVKPCASLQPGRRRRLTTPAQVVARIARFATASTGPALRHLPWRPGPGCSGTGGAFRMSAHLTAAKPVVNYYMTRPVRCKP